MDINNLDTINSKVASYSAKLLPVIKNRTNKEIKFLMSRLNYKNDNGKWNKELLYP